MNGVVLALMLLLVLLVIGAVIYFTQLQETKKDEDTDTDFAPVETIQEIPESDPEPDQEEFDIVNGWIYDTKYNYKLGIKSDGTLNATEYNPDTPDQTSKWSFEPSGSGFHLGTTNGQFLKITSAGADLTSKATGTAKIMLNKNGEGFTLSNSTKKYFIKLEKAKITIVRDEASASTFMIDPSQYYIKNYSSDKYSSGKGGGQIISSLSNFAVACADGVLSSLGMNKVSGKYQYDYSCMEGDVTTGDLLGSEQLTETPLDELQKLTGDGFKVKCKDGALANFKLLQGADGKASYEFDCRDVPVIADTDTGVTTEAVAFSTMSGEDVLGPIAKLGSLKCDEGHVLTGFEFNKEGEGNMHKLSGICKKIAT